MSEQLFDINIFFEKLFRGYRQQWH